MPSILGLIVYGKESIIVSLQSAPEVSRLCEFIVHNTIESGLPREIATKYTHSDEVNISEGRLVYWKLPKVSTDSWF